jgi:hypothetical protein
MRASRARGTTESDLKLSDAPNDDFFVVPRNLEGLVQVRSSPQTRAGSRSLENDLLGVFYRDGAQDMNFHVTARVEKRS